MMITTPLSHLLTPPEPHVDSADTEPMVYDPTKPDEVFDQLADIERADHELLRMVLAAALATALLALAGSLLA